MQNQNDNNNLTTGKVRGPTQMGGIEAVEEFMYFGYRSPRLVAAKSK